PGVKVRIPKPTPAQAAPVLGLLAVTAEIAFEMMMLLPLLPGFHPRMASYRGLWQLGPRPSIPRHPCRAWRQGKDLRWTSPIASRPSGLGVWLRGLDGFQGQGGVG